MPYRESGFHPENIEAELAKQKLDRQEVEARLQTGENFDDTDLAGLELAGLDFDGKSFKGADVRCLSLYEDATGTISRIENTDWTDAIMADFENPTVFCGVEAKGAKFGYTEKIGARRARQQQEGKNPTWEDCGGLFGFVGDCGNFPETKWENLDFGGGTDYSATFAGAVLSRAELVGCDSSGLDLSRAMIDGIKITDSVSLKDLVINEKFIDDVASGLSFTDAEMQAELVRLLAEKGARRLLEEDFEVKIDASPWPPENK